MTTKIQRGIHAARKRQNTMSRLRSEAKGKMERNVADLERVENQMALLNEDGQVPEVGWYIVDLFSCKLIIQY